MIAGFYRKSIFKLQTIVKFNRIKEAYIQKNILKYDFISNSSRKIKKTDDGFSLS